MIRRRTKLFFLNPVTGETITGKELINYKRNVADRLSGSGSQILGVNPDFELLTTKAQLKGKDSGWVQVGKSDISSAKALERMQKEQAKATMIQELNRSRARAENKEIYHNRKAFPKKYRNQPPIGKDIFTPEYTGWRMDTPRFVDREDIWKIEDHINERIPSARRRAFFKKAAPVKKTFRDSISGFFKRGGGLKRILR